MTKQGVPYAIFAWDYYAPVNYGRDDKYSMTRVGVACVKP